MGFYNKCLWLVKPVLAGRRNTAVLLTSMLQVMVILLILYGQVGLAAKSTQGEQA